MGTEDSLPPPRSAASVEPQTDSDIVSSLDRAAEILELESGRILVAVSGGGDSVALLRGLVTLQSRLNCRIFAAHFNHRWRGQESDTDASWVQTLADSLNVPYLTAAAETDLPCSEEAARLMRYDFLTRAAVENNCCFIATGHTADDQAETVLHHILRGTGLAGLRGIPERRRITDEIQIVRPLLDCSRTSLETWLHSIGQSWRTDPANSDPGYTRNRLRTELLPHLETQFNPQVRRVLTTLASQAGEVSRFLRELAEEALPDILLSVTPDSARLDARPLKQLPSVLLRETLILLWHRQAWPLQGMTHAHWTNLAGVVDSGSAVTLPGRIDARLRGELLVLSRHSP